MVVATAYSLILTISLVTMMIYNMKYTICIYVY